MFKSLLKVGVLTVIFFLPFMLNAGEANSTGSKAAKTVNAKDMNTSQESVKAAYKLFDEMNLKKAYNQAVSRATAALVQRGPRLAKVKEKILGFYKKHIGWDAVKDDLAKIYAKHYTVKELNEIVAFYKTPIGQKVLKTMPVIMQEGRRLGEEKMSKNISELQKIINDAIAEKKTKK